MGPGNVAGGNSVSPMSIFMLHGAKPASCDVHKTLDVTMVASLSSMAMDSNWVGSRGAESKSLKLFTISSSAPPHHMGPGNVACGNSVLCCPLVHGHTLHTP